jgi:peroxiredoxin
MKQITPHFTLISAVMAAAGLLLLPCALWAAGLAIGSSMPAFSLTNTDGATTSAESFAGKRAVVVVFLDNHCTYCQAYQSRLINLQKTYVEQGVQFVLINPNVAAGDLAQMKAHAASMKYPFPFLIDDTQSTAKAFGATRTPEAFVFGSDHKLLYRGQIDDNTEEKMVRKADLKLALDAVLKGTPQAIDIPVTSPFGCTIKWR